MTNESAAAANLVEPPKPTLNSLLASLKAVDDEMIEVSLDEQLDLIENGRIKVDNYKYILDKLEVQAIFLEKRREEIQKSLQVINNNIKRIKEHLIYALRSNGFEKFTGHEYVVSVRKAAPAVEVKAEPTVAMKIKYPDYIKTKYEWDKTALKEAVKRGDDPELAELAGLRETFYPKFSIVKE